MPAVAPIARAPQKVTRRVAFPMVAPPACAPIAPSKAKNSNDAAETNGTRIDAGAISTIDSGIAAPTENVAADVSAA